MNINKSPLHLRVIKKEVFLFLLFLIIPSLSNFYVVKGEERTEFEILAIYKENGKILECHVEIRLYGTSIETLNFPCPEFEMGNIHIFDSSGNEIEFTKSFDEEQSKIVLDFGKIISINKFIKIEYSYKYKDLEENFGETWKKENISMSFGENIRKITVHIPEKYLILDYTPAYGKEISEGIFEWNTLGKTGKIQIYYLPFNKKLEKEKFKSGEVKKFYDHIIIHPDILTSKKEIEMRILMMMPNIKEDFGLIFPIALKDPYDVSIYKLSNFDANFDDSEEYQQVFDKETISKNKQTFWIEKDNNENIETIYIHLSNSWKSESYLYYIFGLKGSVIPEKVTPISEGDRKLKFYEGFIDFGVKFPFSEESEVVYVNKLYDFKTEELDFTAYFPRNIDIKKCNPKESEKQNKGEPKYVKWSFTEENTKRDFNFRIYYEIIDQRDTLHLFRYFFGLVLLFMLSTVFAKLVNKNKEFKKYICSISSILVSIIGLYLLSLIIPKNLSEVFSEGYPKIVELYMALSIIFIIIAIFFVYSAFKEKKKNKKRKKSKKKK